MSKIFVSELYPHAAYSAGALREDIETVLALQGYRPVHTGPHSNNIFKRLGAYRSIKKMAREMDAPGLVFFHFPLRSRINRYFFSLLTEKEVKTVAYVHDFEGLRDEDKELLQKELLLLAQFDIIIAQNPRMKKLIETETGKGDVIVLEMYDYLHVTEPVPGASRQGAIVFAGNLRKASFISQLNSLPGLRFNIYGEPGLQTNAPNILYKGKADPRTLPSVIAGDGSYGLVWDGSSIQAGKDAGGYLRINTPHKLALYIMAGLPPIVWKESAMAEWVQQQRIGIAVSSLYDLKESLEGITENEYREFQHNMKEIRRKMAEGYYLKNAMSTAEESF